MEQRLGIRVVALSNASSFTCRLCVSLLPAISLAVAPDFIDRDALLKSEREDPLNRSAAESAG